MHAPRSQDSIKSSTQLQYDNQLMCQQLEFVSDDWINQEGTIPTDATEDTPKVSFLQSDNLYF